MAPTISKPSRPSFSPPRPGKSKITKSNKEKAANTNTKGKAAVRRKSNVEVETGESSTSRVQKSKPRAKTTHNGIGKDKGISKRSGTGGKKKQRGAGGTMRAFLDEDASGTEEEDEDVPRRRARKPREPEEGGVLNEFAASMDTDESGVDAHHHQHKQGRTNGDDSSEDDEDEEEPENDGEEEPAHLDERLDFSSPEPDFILAEVTHPSHDKASSSAADYAIPLPLIHRIMHASFTSPSRTALSSDARSLIGKYMEIFVKEAVRRCVDEKKERVQQGGEGDVGWLEVEDLERVGSQLVLDF